MPQISIDKRFLRVVSEKSAFSVSGVERTARLYNLLDEIKDDSALSGHLALKGGTALNLFIFSEQPRVSEDLDFNLYGMDVINKQQNKKC